MVEVTKLVNIMLIFLTLFVVALSIDKEYTVCSLHSDCKAYVCQLPLKPECILLEYVPHFYRLTCSCV
ncbi:putative Late nodulin [Medicago truncatula]|uniref:Nodule Cysteine-Rich (NCR) secreted peptide n=1 Tax=Medicago truncatula TaxID=3880 RepID=A0A072TJN6_MEDTR|nr:Nodule Cysteine-Rich (NCR) secreted peptide [Medicago truncatula]RHN60004.1 putative Late nodulin [Medicago truncatula]